MTHFHSAAGIEISCIQQRLAYAEKRTHTSPAWAACIVSGAGIIVCEDGQTGIYCQEKKILFTSIEYG